MHTENTCFFATGWWYSKASFIDIFLLCTSALHAMKLNMVNKFIETNLYQIKYLKTCSVNWTEQQFRNHFEPW